MVIVYRRGCSLDGPLQTLRFLFRYEIQNGGYSRTQAKKKMCVSDRPTDPKILPPILTFIYSKKKQTFKIRKFVSVSDFNNRHLTVAILTLSDKRLIETDLLKTSFLFEFSSFPCTFGWDKNIRIVENHPMNIHVQFGFTHICSF